MYFKDLILLARKLLFVVHMQHNSYVAVMRLFVGIHSGHLVLPLECEWIETFIVFLFVVCEHESIFEPEVIRYTSIVNFGQYFNNLIYIVCIDCESVFEEDFQSFKYSLSLL